MIDRQAAKQKEIETRRRLGRRLPKSPPAPITRHLEPRMPRATGAAADAIRHGGSSA